jgi:hypothetical protein
MAVRLFWSMLRWGTFRQHGAYQQQGANSLCCGGLPRQSTPRVRSMARDGGPVIWESVGSKNVETLGWANYYLNNC